MLERGQTHSRNHKRNSDFTHVPQRSLLLSPFHPLKIMFDAIWHCPLAGVCDTDCPSLAPSALLWLSFLNNPLTKRRCRRGQAVPVGLGVPYSAEWLNLSECQYRRGFGVAFYTLAPWSLLGGMPGISSGFVWNWWVNRVMRRGGGEPVAAEITA